MDREKRDDWGKKMGCLKCGKIKPAHSIWMSLIFVNDGNKPERWLTVCKKCFKEQVNRTGRFHGFLRYTSLPKVSGVNGVPCEGDKPESVK